MGIEIRGWWEAPAKEKFRQLKYAHIAHERKRGIRCDNHLTFEQVIQTLEYFNCECPYCGDVVSRDGYIFGYLDHSVPLADGGKFEFRNILLCCGVCNMNKRDVDLDEWLQRNCTPERATKVRRFKSGK